MNYPQIRLKKGREKSADNYHPWIFSGAVEKAEQMKDGDIAAVVSSDDRILGYGFYDRNSQIICRIFHFGDDDQEFNSAYWDKKFFNAFRLRDMFAILPDTNCYRLVHAEGDGLPGLIIDIYNETAVIQFLIKGTYFLREIIFGCLNKLGFRKIYVKNDPLNSGGYRASEESETLVETMENGLRFFVDIAGGQKTGFFIDQRDNRRIASSVSDSKKVLNLFAYTGGFSAACFQGGASKVVSVDVSKTALALCSKNVMVNFPAASHEIAEADCFQYLRDMNESFDVIIIDPPAFAKNQSSVNKASRGYKDLNLLAIRKIASPGLILSFSCSQHVSRDLFQKIIFAAAADAGRQVRILKHLEQPKDHPVNIFHPESEYLKGLMLWVE